MEEEYIHELENMPEDKDADESTSSTTGLGGTKSKMIGLSDHILCKQDSKRVQNGEK